MGLKRYSLYENGMEEDENGRYVVFDGRYILCDDEMEEARKAEIRISCVGDEEGSAPMTDEQAAAKIEEFGRTLDLYNRHLEADSLLCELLKGLGYAKVVAAFEAMDKEWA